MMMKLMSGAIVLAAFAVAVPAEAARQFDTRQLTCAQVNQVIQERGQVVMDTGPRTYQRFVANRGFCDRDQFTRAAFAPTTDNPNCAVQWMCQRRPAPNN